PEVRFSGPNGPFIKQIPPKRSPLLVQSVKSGAELGPKRRIQRVREIHFSRRRGEWRVRPPTLLITSALHHARSGVAARSCRPRITSALRQPALTAPFDREPETGRETARLRSTESGRVVRLWSAGGRPHLVGLRTFLTLGDFELDPLALVKRAVTLFL